MYQFDYLLDNFDFIHDDATVKLKLKFSWIFMIWYGKSIVSDLNAASDAVRYLDKQHIDDALPIGTYTLENIVTSGYSHHAWMNNKLTADFQGQLILYYGNTKSWFHS